MFESRRTFLQELLAAAGALGLDPLQGVATEGDEYSNARLALRLRRPPGWDFSSVADFAALRDQQVLIDSVDGEVQRLKDPRRTGTFRVLQEPVSIQLQGARGTWSHWSYLHELDNGTSHQLIVRSLVVFREPRVHTFHYVELPGSRRRPESTWENFLGSISYELARRDPRVRRDSRRITRKIDRAAVAAEPHLVWNAVICSTS